MVTLVFLFLRPEKSQISHDTTPTNVTLRPINSRILSSPPFMSMTININISFILYREVLYCLQYIVYIVQRGFLLSKYFYYRTFFFTIELTRNPYYLRSLASGGTESVVPVHNFYV